jgi:hypothetical protein
LNKSDSESNSESNSDSDVDDCDGNEHSQSIPPLSSGDRPENLSVFGLKGPLKSLYHARREVLYGQPSLLAAFTKDLCKLDQTKVKEPIKFVVGKKAPEEVAYTLARYLQCLQTRINTFPNRRKRRLLSTQQAGAIVQLINPKFSSLISALQSQWGQHMPKALFTDDKTHEMLYQLENALFTGFALPVESSFNLIWDDKKDGRDLPLPVMGLEFTLRYYFPVTSINLSNIPYLSLVNRPLTGTSLGRHELIQSPSAVG